MPRMDDDLLRIYFEVAEELSDYDGGNPWELKSNLKTPREIVKELDKTVVGQEKAKELLSVAVWNRLLSMHNKITGKCPDDYYFEKNNILLIGGTGCGKTHLIRALAKIVGVPLIIEDATSFTSTGYVGRDVNDCLVELVEEAKNVIESTRNTSVMVKQDVDRITRDLAEFGIIYIDEADKIRATGERGKDVNGKSVQESFLKMIEGEDIRVKCENRTNFTINTRNILFIFGGAFADMQGIIEMRTHEKSIGFSSKIVEKTAQDRYNLFQKANIKDFTMFGIIPELMGRLPVVAVLKDLDRDTIFKIFSEPEKSIMSQIINEFKSYGVQASFTDDAINYIIDETMKLNLGARGLKSTTQQLLRPLLFHLPSYCNENLRMKLIITKDMIIEINKDNK